MVEQNVEGEQAPEVNEEKKPEALQQEEGQKSEVKKEEDYKTKFFYLAAEMENMKKRYEREKENFLKFGNEKLLSQLISVLDDLDRSLEHVMGECDEEKVKGLVDGLKMVQKNFVEVLEKNGVSAILALGETFDPNVHEAMAQQPNEEKKDGEILMEYQKGYTLNGRLLRPSKVIVVKNN